MTNIRLLGGVLLALVLGAPLSAAAQAPTVEYYHVDALGSVRAVTNASGGVVRRHDYAPFGEELATVLGADQTRFVGRERDVETGLDYSMARFYAARWGRFTTVDPGHVGGNIFDPQSWNAYGYARNNPLRFVDPLGTAYYVEGEGGQPFWIHDDRDLWRYTQDGTRFTNGKIFNRSGAQIGTYLHFEDFPALLGEIAYGTGPLVPAVGVAATIVEVGLSFAYPVAGAVGSCAGYGCSKKDVALAMVPHLRVTRMMHSTARIIAEGRRIHKVDQLVAKFGGQANKWVKMSAVDAAGREIHWYQHPGIGKVGIKLAGQPDPF